MTTTKSSPRQADVLVIGGGPAGSTVAALLARRGHDVLLLERERFPRYHIGESLITGMLGVIEELGLTDRLDAMGFPRKHGISLVWGDDPQLWSVTFGEAGAYEYSYHVRRAEFDELLLTRARELGVRVIENACVKDLVMAGDRVAGVRWACTGDEKDGETRETRARIVIDASGQSRVLGRRLSPVVWQEDLRNVAIWTYYSPYDRLPPPQETHILVEATEGGWFWGIPVSETTLSVGYVTPASTLDGASRTGARMFEERVRGTQVLKGLIAKGERQRDLRTTRDWSHMSESFQGSGWLVVGDSATFIDPLFSSGVWLGMSGAWLAARAVDAALGDSGAERAAFERYERLYRQLATDMLAYVRYFYDPTRKREDYFQRAQAAMEVVTGQSRVAFIALISGITALPDMDDAELLKAPASGG